MARIKNWKHKTIFPKYLFISNGFFLLFVIISIILNNVIAIFVTMILFVLSLITSYSWYRILNQPDRYKKITEILNQLDNNYQVYYDVIIKNKRFKQIVDILILSNKDIYLINYYPLTGNPVASRTSLRWYFKGTSILNPLTRITKQKRIMQELFKDKEYSFNYLAVFDPKINLKFRHLEVITNVNKLLPRIQKTDKYGYSNQDLAVIKEVLWKEHEDESWDR